MVYLTVEAHPTIHYSKIQSLILANKLPEQPIFIAVLYIREHCSRENKTDVYETSVFSNSNSENYVPASDTKDIMSFVEGILAVSLAQHNSLLIELIISF